MSDKQSIEFLQERIKAARRQIPSDLVLKEGRVTGVQVFFKSENKLDSGACPGPRPACQSLVRRAGPGFAGMTEKGLSRLFTKPSMLNDQCEMINDWAKGRHLEDSL